jgi:hypothetical protein
LERSKSGARAAGFTFESKQKSVSKSEQIGANRSKSEQIQQIGANPGNRSKSSKSEQIQQIGANPANRSKSRKSEQNQQIGANPANCSKSEQIRAIK